MVRERAPLAELHLHLYGTVRHDHFLRYIESRPFTWDRYEAGMEAAYGVRPPLRDILERHRAGDEAAAREFETLFVFGDADAGNFARFQAKYDMLIDGSEFASVRDGDHGRLPHLVDEMLAHAAASRADHRRRGVGYAEQRVMIGRLLRGEGSETALRSMLAAYAASDGTDLVERLAVSLPRDDPWPSWEIVERLARSEHGHVLTAIDFCFIEEGDPPKAKAELYAAVDDFNERHPDRALARLHHVGESFTDKGLESAIRWVQEIAEMGCDRLGHAIALGVDPAAFGPHVRTESVDERRDQLHYDLAHADGLARHGVHVDRAAADAELRALASRAADDVVEITYDAARLDEVRCRQDYAMERVRATGAVIEVCPTSNRRIGGIIDESHHPVHRFLEREMRVIVASDDPGILGTDLHAELDWVARVAGLDAEQRDDLAAESWRARSELLSGRAV